jgi:hypothetical protein
MDVSIENYEEKAKLMNSPQLDTDDGITALFVARILTSAE